MVACFRYYVENTKHWSIFGKGFHCYQYSKLIIFSGICLHKKNPTIFQACYLSWWYQTYDMIKCWRIEFIFLEPFQYNITITLLDFIKISFKHNRELQEYCFHETIKFLVSNSDMSDKSQLMVFLEIHNSVENLLQLLLQFRRFTYSNVIWKVELAQCMSVYHF